MIERQSHGCSIIFGLPQVRYQSYFSVKCLMSVSLRVHYPFKNNLTSLQWDMTNGSYLQKITKQIQNGCSETYKTLLFYQYRRVCRVLVKAAYSLQKEICSIVLSTGRSRCNLRSTSIKGKKILKKSNWEELVDVITQNDL